MATTPIKNRRLQRWARGICECVTGRAAVGVDKPRWEPVQLATLEASRPDVASRPARCRVLHPGPTGVGKVAPTLAEVLSVFGLKTQATNYQPSSFKFGVSSVTAPVTCNLSLSSWCLGVLVVSYGRAGARRGPPQQSRAAQAKPARAPRKRRACPATGCSGASRPAGSTRRHRRLGP